MADLSITCDSPPIGYVGEPYSHAFPASGGTPPYTFVIILGDLPTGLTLDFLTGIASGTPTVKGIFTFTVHAGDATEFGEAAVECSITIRGKCLADVGI
jgi:hypothetical protein